MNTSNMTDYELNRACAEKLGYRVSQASVTKTEGAQWVRLEGGPVRNFDPCNSWADAGPIIEKLASMKGSLHIEGTGVCFIPKPLDYATHIKDKTLLKSFVRCFLEKGDKD